jgi:hypothetical protein
MTAVELRESSGLMHLQARSDPGGSDASFRSKIRGLWLVFGKAVKSSSGFSYGFRPGRSTHDAMDALIVGITSTGYWTPTFARSSTR